MRLFSEWKMVLGWLLDHVVDAVNVYEYAVNLNNYLNSCQKRAITFVHFLYHSLQKSFRSEERRVGKEC